MLLLETKRRTLQHRVDWRSAGRRGLAMLFVAALAITSGPTLLAMLLNADRFPDFSSWKKFPARFESFVNEHLAGRGACVATIARIKVLSLNASTTPKVWIGNDGWLFFNHAADLHPTLAAEPELTSTIDAWDRLLRWRRDWCRRLGVPLVFVVAPDKQTIYPEHLPPVIREREPSHVLDRVLDRLRVEPALPVVDLRADFRAAKEIDQMYLRTDSHWSPFGCWRGYARTVEALAMKSIEWQTQSVYRTASNPGDLWRLLGVPGSPPPDVVAYPRLADPAASLTDEVVPLADDDRLNHLRPAVWARKDGRGPRVILFCDSFADERFQELLAQHCSRLVVVPTYQMTMSLIERERPDAVVIQVVERALMTQRPYVARP